MSIHDPTMVPGAFGDIDGRDTHPVPGEEPAVFPPIEPPSEAIFDGAATTLPLTGGGVGGSLEGDVTVQSDGYQTAPPERHAPDEAALDETGAEIEGTDTPF